MKQFLAPIVFVWILLLAAFGTKAQIISDLYYYDTALPGFNNNAGPLWFCDETSTIRFRVIWDNNSTTIPITPASVSNPYRFTCKIYRNNISIYTHTYLNSVPRISFDHAVLSVFGFYQSEIILDIETANGWVTYKDSIGNNWWGGPVNVYEKSCCPSDILISGNYTTALTESATWIESSGPTKVPNGANVKLDAARKSYVLLNNGFEAQGGSVFVAEAYNGCRAGAPQKPAAEPAEETALSVLATEDREGLSVYPNPTSGQLTIRHTAEIKQLQVYNIMGALILTIPTTGTTETRVDMTGYTKGTYFVKAIGMPVKRVIRN